MQGVHVTKLGSTSHPWQLKAILRVGSGDNAMATLIGNDTVEFTDGWANFTTLGISHAGSGFIIDFEVIFPTDSTFAFASTAMTINERNIKALVVGTTADVYEGNAHTFTIKLQDADTNTIITDIAWSVSTSINHFSPLHYKMQIPIPLSLTQHAL